MKKTISILLALLIMLSCISVVSASATTNTAEITLNGNTYTFTVGEEVTYKCDVKIDEVTENGQFIIGYPENILKVENLNLPVADKVGGAMCNYGTETTVNLLKITYSKASSKPEELYDYTKGDTLFVVTFKVVGAGTGKIEIDKTNQNFVMANMNGQNIVSKAVFTETLNGENKVFSPLEISATRKNLFVKKNTTLKVTGGANGAVVWKSSNTKVATVDNNGKVTAKKKGTAVISATKGNETVKCTVTVKNPTVKAKKSTIKINATTKIKVKNAVGNTTFKALNNKAKVNAKGKVTGLKKGTAKIKVVASGVKFKLKIKVK